MVLSCIDTAEVILSDLRDSGAETTENLKKLVDARFFYYIDSGDSGGNLLKSRSQASMGEYERVKAAPN